MSNFPNQQQTSDSVITGDGINDSLTNQKKPFLKRAFGPIRKGALRAAILTILASSMGTGIFNLPERAQEIGIIPFIFFVIACGGYSYLGMQLLSEMIRQHNVTSYSDMAQRAYGKVLRRISQFCLIVYPWGITICFQVILAKFSTQLLYDVLKVGLYDNAYDRQKDHLNSQGTYRIKKGELVRILINVGVICVSMIFILQRQIQTIKKLAYIGVASVLFNFSIVIVTSVTGFTRINSHNQQVEYNGIFNRKEGQLVIFTGDMSSLFQGVAAIFFCYVSHQMIFPLVEDLRHPTKKRLTKIFTRSVFSLLIIYGCTGLFTYILLSEHSIEFPIEAVCIASITTDIMSLGKAIMVVALFVAVSLNMFPARKVFVETFNINTTSKKNHILVCVGLAGSSCLVAVLFVKVNSYFGLLGGTAGVMMAGGIPALCYFKLMKLTYKHYIMLVFVAIVTLFAVTGAILSVVAPV